MEESSEEEEDTTENKDNSDDQPLKTPIKQGPNDTEMDVPENKDNVNTSGDGTGGIVPNDKELHSNGMAPIKNEPKSPSRVPEACESNSNSANVSVGNGANVGTGQDVSVKNVCIDPLSDEIQSKLTELGCLIVDENVLYALKNLKEMGEMMKRAVENDAEAHNKQSKHNHVREACLKISALMLVPALLQV